ncbi:EthD family reductase [Jiella sp. M17.18]|uniref:EthD family reductase n=1 Tax=Jiella sp. M17.18 TaxID=3234247 RepID=UPI0034DFE397
MARMIVVYKEPQDVEAFNRHYFETHVPLAKRLPGLRRYEVSRGPIMSPFGPSNAFMIATLHFDDMAAIKEAFASDVGKACSADRQTLAPDLSRFET